MKTNYKAIRMLTFLFVAIGGYLSAQLNGAYTINSALGTGGTNFQTFSAFAAALNSQGIGSPVTVNVSGGPFVEQVNFTQAAGVSATNTITINGNGCLLQFTGTSGAPWILSLSGADRMFIHNLNVEGIGNYAHPLVFTGGANYNTMTNCTFSVPANSGGVTSQIPVMFSGSNQNYSTAGASGNYNKLKNCQLFSGYFAFAMYSSSPGTAASDNTFENCRFEDFYYYGNYVYYAKNLTIKQCTISRPTRTNLTTGMGTYMVYCEGLMFDGNIIEKFFEQNQTNGNVAYGIYALYNAQGGGVNPNRIQNNIVRDMKSNGQIWAMYTYYLDGFIINNTISLDHAGSTSGSTTYGGYCYGGPGYYLTMRNNLITITRGGGGQKVGMYIPVAGNVTTSNNNMYVTGTNSLVGFYNSNHATIASMQAQGIEQNSISMDPMYTNLAAGNLLPTNTSMNNLGTPAGVVLDQQLMPRSGTDPDIGALEFLSVPCTGTPNPGSVLTPTYLLCPGESANMVLSNFSSDLGITYQWSSASFSVGPWVPISGANSVLYTAPNVMTTTWFQASVTCGNSGLGVTPVGVVNVAGITTNTAPYYEDFEGIPLQNKLPNCSWYSPELGGGAYTYIGSNTLGRVARSGNKFASFNYLPAGQKTFYTNGIYMYAGITYSASVWYTTEYYGYNNWTDLSLLVGPNQTAVGQQTIVSTNGPAISNIYKSLSGTFQVPTDGFYHAQVRATSVSGSAQYLSWDDLRIEIPCSINSPTINVTSNQATVCANQPVTIQASGADSYSWSTTDQGDIITVTPQFAGMNYYTVTGTSSLSGCSVSATQPVMVNPAPILSTFAVPPVVCEGSVVNLYATGAVNYIWTTNATGPVATLTPVSSNTYAVVGTNQFNCQSTAVIQVMVNAKPIISATYPSNACVGDAVTINASGGVSYQIMSMNSLNFVNPAVVMPTASTQYTIHGTDMNGCSNSTVVTVIVNECLDISENHAMESLRVYPNPTTGEFTMELRNNAEKNVEIADVTGRIIVAQRSTEQQVGLNIGTLANGVYYVKVRSLNAVQVIRIIKE